MSIVKRSQLEQGMLDRITEAKSCVMELSCAIDGWRFEDADRLLQRVRILCSEADDYMRMIDEWEDTAEDEV